MRRLRFRWAPPNRRSGRAVHFEPRAAPPGASRPAVGRPAVARLAVAHLAVALPVARRGAGLAAYSAAHFAPRRVFRVAVRPAARAVDRILPAPPAPADPLAGFASLVATPPRRRHRRRPGRSRHRP